MWPQQTWDQRSSRGQWPLVQVFGKSVSTYFDVFSNLILQWLQKYVIAKAGETRGSRTALFNPDLKIIGPTNLHHPDLHLAQICNLESHKISPAQWHSQRGAGGWLPPWQKLCPLSPPNEITLCTEVYGEPPFWVPVSPPPSLTPEPSLPLPHFEKSGYAPGPCSCICCNKLRV